MQSHEEKGYQVEDKIDVEAEYIQKEEFEVVQTAISELTDKYRQVMEMRYLQQQSYQEISERLDKPINTVGTLLNRAKKRLATGLYEQETNKQAIGIHGERVGRTRAG